MRSLDIPRSPNAAMLLAAKRALSEAGPDALRTAAHGLLLRRASLSVTADAQKITLGVIAAYVVVIAILWNIPYVRYVLWPFKMLVIAFHECQYNSSPFALSRLLCLWGSPRMYSFRLCSRRSRLLTLNQSDTHLLASSPAARSSLSASTRARAASRTCAAARAPSPCRRDTWAAH